MNLTTYGDTNLTIVYQLQSNFEVQTRIYADQESPKYFSRININDTLYKNNDIAYLYGTYTLTCNISEYYTFDYWNFSGDIDITDTTSNSTTLIATGDGTIYLYLTYYNPYMDIYAQFPWLLGFVGCFMMMLGSIMTVVDGKSHNWNRALIWILIIVPIGFALFLGWVYG